MSVTKTNQGTWRARIRDRNGKQLSKTFKLKADALAWEREQLRKRDGGELAQSPTHGSVAQWANQWLASARNLSQSSQDTYQRDLDRYILPKIGGYRLIDLSTEDIDQMVTELLEAGYAPSSVHRHYRTVRRMLQVAVERGRLPANPAEPVKPPRIPHREMRFLSIPQLELLADTINDRYRAWVLVAGYGGLRWGEMLALRPKDVNDGVLSVGSQLVMQGGKWVRVPPKTKNSRRQVPLPPSVAEELACHLDAYARETVFVNQNGQPISHPSFTGNVFKPALVRARLDRQLRIHDLRHTAVAIAIQAGAHPKAIQRRMGHASIAVTLDTYGHLMPDIESTLASDIEALREVFLMLDEEAQTQPPDLRIV